LFPERKSRQKYLLKIYQNVKKEIKNLEKLVHKKGTFRVEKYITCELFIKTGTFVQYV
jgi:hypothetical protein